MRHKKNILDPKSHMDVVMHNWCNLFFDILSNQTLKVSTFLVNQAAEIKPLKAQNGNN